MDTLGPSEYRYQNGNNNTTGGIWPFPDSECVADKLYIRNCGRGSELGWGKIIFLCTFKSLEVEGSEQSEVAEFGHRLLRPAHKDR